MVIGDTLLLAGRHPRAGMRVLLGVGAVLAVGDPVVAPAGEVVGMGVVPIGAVIQEQAEADAMELVGGVDGSAPDPHTTLLGGDEDLAEGGMVTGGEVGHPGQDVAVEGLAAAGYAEAFVRVVVARLVEDRIEADESPHLVSPVEAWGVADEVEVVSGPEGRQASNGEQMAGGGVEGDGFQVLFGPSLALEPVVFVGEELVQAGDVDLHDIGWAE